MALRALVVEDNSQIAELIRRGTRELDLACDVLGDGRSALQQLRMDLPDIVLLDLSLPGIDGLEVLKLIRANDRYRRLPIIIMSARSEEADRILGLELGADDYVVKPFSVRELAARIRAVLRRTREMDEGDVLRAGTLVVDEERREATLAGDALKLPPREFALLAALMRARGRVLSRDRLLEDVWGRQPEALPTRTVDVHVRGLRAKLGPEASRLVTHLGAGYAFRVD